MIFRRIYLSVKFRTFEMCEGISRWVFWRFPRLARWKRYSFSQLGQDLFVLETFGDSRGLTFLEVGSNEPLRHSNTALLESAYGWRGVGIEICPDLVSKFRAKRKAPCILADATEIDYAVLLKTHFGQGFIDYLSLDVEPASVTYATLLKILESGFKFRCITFEHDRYKDGDEFKDLAFETLSKLGFVRVKENIGLEGWGDIEDWYVSEEFLDEFNQRRNLRYWDPELESSSFRSSSAKKISPIEHPQINTIFNDYFTEEIFFDAFAEQSFEGGISVVIPAAHVNDFWRSNLVSVYREIPVAELLIGDAGLPEDALSILTDFPRVQVFDHKDSTLGYSLRKLIGSVESEWFVYLHSDVYLPKGWFRSMSAHMPSADWIGSRMLQTTLWLSETDYGERPYAGAQLGRRSVFTESIEVVEDDYVWRQEDFVLAAAAKAGNGRVANAVDAFHFHQLVSKPSSVWNPSIELSVTAHLDRPSLERVASTQYFGIIKYLSPSTRWARQQAAFYCLELLLSCGYPPKKLLNAPGMRDNGWRLRLPVAVTCQIPSFALSHLRRFRRN